MTGAADDDPSGIGTYSQVGAAFRFGLLWTALFTFPLAAAVQETAARLGLATGRGLASLIRERFPGWVLYAAVALVTMANVFNIGADLGSMAAAVRLLVPLPFLVLILALTATMVSLEVAVPYHRYARVLRWLTVSLVAYIAVLFVVKTDWASVARHTFIPTFSFDRIDIAALIAIFGTTISPYLFFWQASEEVEEELEHNELPPVDAGHVSVMRTDVIGGMGSAVIVMFAIMVAAGATLGRQGITTVQTADQAALALKPIAGSLASLLFTLGILGTGALAVPVLAGSTAYALSEALGWHEGLSRTFRQARGFYGVLIAATVVGVALNFSGINPVRALYFAAILNALAAPPLILLMLILSNSERVMGRWRGGRLSNVLLGLSLVAMAGLPLAYLVAG